MTVPVGTAGARLPAVAAGTRDEGHGIFSFDLGLAFATALVLPLALNLGGLGGLTRLTYPAAAFGAAWYLWSKGSLWYVGLCIWLFCACPLVRRLHDYGAGFDQASPILLAPYLAAAWAALSGLGLFIRGTERLAVPIAVAICCVLYGWVLAVIDGRLISGSVDLMRWTAGPCVALYILSMAWQQEELHRVVVGSFMVAAPVMALYGLFQFISPLPWDLEWSREMLQLGVESMGRPEPFELRVYATMHSPGSLGAYLMVGTLVLLGAPLPAALLGLLLSVLGLALTQYRTIWVGTAVGLLCVLLSGPLRQRLRLMIGGLALVFSLGSLATIPDIQETLSQRVRSLTELKSDASGEDRLRQYARFFEVAQDRLIGDGIAASGLMRQTDKKPSAVIDSGILEAYHAFGVPIGTVFFACLGCIVWRILRSSRATLTHANLYKAVVLATVVQIPFGTVYIGEAGFTLWVFIGLATAAEKSS